MPETNRKSLREPLMADLGNPIRVIEIQPLEVPVPLEVPQVEPAEVPIEVET